jgi:hypothetical protein
MAHNTNILILSLQTMQRVLLNCMYTSLDYAQTGLIAAVFFFKVSSPISALGTQVLRLSRWSNLFFLAHSLYL